MTKYSTLNKKLSNLQLDKLKSAIKIGTEITFSKFDYFIKIDWIFQWWD